MNALRWTGVVILAALGLPLTGIGLIGLGDPTGRGFLCFGLVLLVSAAGGVARLLAERAAPPEP
ncbi:MAG: hypothetical protein ACRDOM_02200, partial [Nocardioides sp.]